ncbi:GTPase IMAP family member 8 isoform X2 [Lates calcarifer]|uniref:GTPase IMAP family member 8 isoform X2 n=1 Tax=Lates calcarifer TaxID=8187 RepID=A0AAJ8DKQ9_LATCA|nr:GTPase IMAP family member 8 isoform X2 [Lates calcarifer]
MSDKKKISVIILGGGDSSRRDLTARILERDGSDLQPKETEDKHEKYGNDTCEVTCLLNDKTAHENIKKLNQQPDVCLLLLEDGFSTDTVQQQIDDLHKSTGIHKEKIRVVLPLSHAGKDHSSSLCKFHTMEEVCSEVRKLTEDTNLKPNNKRNDEENKADRETENDRPQASQTETEETEKLDSPQQQPDQQPEQQPDQQPEQQSDQQPDQQPDQQSDQQSESEQSESQTETTDGRPSKVFKTEEERVNLVLLGMTGTGKSATGNTILRDKHFTSRPSSNPVTTECKAVEREICGTAVRVIDTPDIFDDEISDEVRREHVKRCKDLCQSEPCVYLLVMQVGRFTDGERDIMTKLERAVGRGVHKQTIILFTCGEELQRAEMTLEDFLDSCQPDLKRIIEKCNNRCVLFENRDTDSDQVETLMQTVREMPPITRGHDHSRCILM